MADCATPEKVPQCRGLSSVLGTELEPFLRGFQECGFRFDVERFVTEHASAFVVACPDGSHPLAWTDLHRQYKELFDCQLDTILEYHTNRSIEREEFLAFCTQLVGSAEKLPDDAELPSTGGARVKDFHEFIQALTASEDYMRFVHVMFEEVARLGLSGPSLDVAVEQSSAQEIEVTVPEGYGPGELLAVDFLGCRYNLSIPVDCGPGSVFRAALPVA